jgi:large subunit ribosomal protein L15
VKTHDLRPAPGSRTPRTRVGRGIAAGKGKTAGRGTKGQRSRAGASIPSWFEGGQTPIHIRIPKLRGFKRYGRVEYQVVNIGRIGEYARAGRFGGDPDGREPIAVNAEVLRAAGLVSSADKPLKILGGGDVDVKLVVAAEAFTAGARSKIEAAGGFVQPLRPEPATPRADDAAPTGTAAGAKRARRRASTVGADAETEARPGDAPASPSSDGDATIPEVATADEPAEEPATDQTADVDRATE